MKIYKEKISFKSSAEVEFIDITDAVQRVVDASGVREGHVSVFVQHTTMGIVINHNEPMLLQDFMRVLYRIAPQDDRYSHDMFELRKNNKTDGRSNGHSHCKAMMIGSHVSVPLENGKMMLAHIQSILAVDFDGARNRDAIVTVSG
ncbi:MAG: secondary thiamine-phosphate synthase enzyme YjbQ [Parcubacteria group bacterium]